MTKETAINTSNEKYTFTAKGSKGNFDFTISELTKDSVRKAMPFLNPFDGSTPDYLLAGEILLKENFIDGDTIVLTDIEYTIGASVAVISLIKIATVDLKKN